MLNNIVENFKLIKKEIEVFLGINYVMAVHKLPAIKNYWKYRQFTDKEGIRNEITTARPLITHFKESLFRVYQMTALKVSVSTC